MRAAGPRSALVGRRGGAGAQNGAMPFHVDSETGRLRRVILHRPGLELKRPTPTNKDELLFDDVLWVRRAQQEHDIFAALLSSRGVEVRLLGELLGVMRSKLFC